MNKTLLKIIIGVLLLLCIILMIINYKSPNRPFKTVEISGENYIYNNVYPTYYDTVLGVAMNQMGLINNNVVIMKLTDNSKNQFDGELKAHIRYLDSIFYLFIIDLDRNDAIEVLSHEVIHMDQYLRGKLVYDSTVNWMGQSFDLKSMDYDIRPWEKDAFDRQGTLIKNVKDTLWGD